MNTRKLFEDAKGAKLTRPILIAHTIWALVSQAGRSAMAVGEVCDLIAMTSTIHPSPYQVKSAMRELNDMRAVDFVNAGTRGRGNETRYQAGDAIIAALICYSYGLAGSGVHDAAMQATFALWDNARGVLKDIADYNRQLDENALDQGNE